MKRLLMGFVVVGLVGLMAATSLAAQSCPVCNAADGKYPDKVPGQFARGAANVGGSWLELFNQPMKETKESGWATGMTIGVAKGVGHTCLRLVKGAAEVVTSPFPHAADGSHIASDCPLGIIGLTDR